jgi:3'-phosphoadenosine 5'-phosphosulfate sulfotransferase (PAPS reductase)/FAD synthetase
MTSNHIVGFSGGIASSVVARIVLEEHSDATLLFHDTKTEPEDNDRFRQDVSNYLKTPITEDSDGRNIWELFNDEGYLGCGRNTMCSRVLKQERSKAYLKAHLPATLYIGFTDDEWNRAQRITARYASIGVTVKFPLMEQHISKEECHHRVINCWGLNPPEMYEHFEHANCIPCVKGSQYYWGLLHKYEREAWERMAAAEKEYAHTLFSDGTLLEKLPNCLRLAEKYEQMQEGERRQVKLFEFPCECSV